MKKKAGFCILGMLASFLLVIAGVYFQEVAAIREQVSGFIMMLGLIGLVTSMIVLETRKPKQPTTPQPAKNQANKALRHFLRKQSRGLSWERKRDGETKLLLANGMEEPRLLINCQTGELLLMRPEDHKFRNRTTARYSYAQLKELVAFCQKIGYSEADWLSTLTEDNWREWLEKNMSLYGFIKELKGGYRGSFTNDAKPSVTLLALEGWASIDINIETGRLFLLTLEHVGIAAYDSAERPISYEQFRRLVEFCQKTGRLGSDADKFFTLTENNWREWLEKHGYIKRNEASS